MSQQEMLESCLQISGSFENGDPAYDAITGNFDGMGMSVGILQWNAGTGTLAMLLQKMIQNAGGIEPINAFFANGENVASIAQMAPAQAKQFVITSFTKDGMHLTPQAIQDWQQMLQADFSIAAQLDMAVNGVLAKAMTLAGQFTQTLNMRDIAFFFDLVTQSGGMANSRGSVTPLLDPNQSTWQQAIAFTQSKSAKSAEYWQTVCATDTQARILLHYAYQRALLSRPEYTWAALSRRGAIACRGGVVNGSWFDFSQSLP